MRVLVPNTINNIYLLVQSFNISKTVLECVLHITTISICLSISILQTCSRCGYEPSIHIHTTHVCMYLCVYVYSVKDFVHKLLGLVLFFLFLSSPTFNVIIVIIWNKVRFNLLSVLRIFFFSFYFNGFSWEFLRVWEKLNFSHFAGKEKTVTDEKSKL